MNKHWIYSHLRLDRDSSTPLITQLVDGITWLIASGDLKEGDRLPPIRELANALGIHMHTVRQAYQRLEADQLVSIRTRRGTVVLPYDPVAVAARGAESYSYLLGVILPAPTSFYDPYVQSIQDVARELRYLPLFCYTYENPFLVETYFNQLVARGVDGFIITSLSLPSVVEDPGLLDKYPPIVSVDMPDMPGYCVLIDTEGAAYQITKHLIDHQKKRIGLIIPPLENPNVVPFFHGYQRAMEENGLQVDPDLIAGVEGFFDHHGREGAEKLMAIDQPPDAILGASDVLALGAMGVLGERGLSVPDDIALAGYNDILAASLVQPGLTTASISAKEMGSIALQTLQDLIHGNIPKSKTYEIPTELIIRASCGCSTI